MDIKTLACSITIATAGLTTCNNTGGAVDPAPPPLQCSDAGNPLEASGTLSGNRLTMQVVFVANQVMTWNGTPSILNVNGGTLVSATVSPTTPHTVDVVLDLSSVPASGNFTVSGTVSGDGECPVTQTITFTVGDAGAVMFSSLEDALPLRSRAPASIVVTSREGGAVELRPGGAQAGSRVTWTATAGSVAVKTDGVAMWELPHEPGLYQIELLVERGDDGLALDTLTLEVT